MFSESTEQGVIAVPDRKEESVHRALKVGGFLSNGPTDSEERWLLKIRVYCHVVLFN